MSHGVLEAAYTALMYGLGFRAVPLDTRSAIKESAVLGKQRLRLFEIGRGEGGEENGKTPGDERFNWDMKWNIFFRETKKRRSGDIFRLIILF